MKRFTLIGVAIAAFTLAVVPSLEATAQSAKLIQIDGSSTVFPITEAVAEEFQAKNRGKINVTVGVSGSGGGFKQFCAGEIDIANASRPIKSAEMDLCKQNGIKYVEIPVARDALTVVINQNNPFVDMMTIEELKKLWSSETNPKVTTWSQIRPGWPNQKISLYGPGTDSGTFDYFSEEVLGKGGSSRADYVASEDDNLLVQGVSRDKNALGYFGFAYYLENKDLIKAVPIDSGAGPVVPSSETVENSTYTPLSRPLFIYVSDQALNRPEVSSFIGFYLDNAADLSSEVGYVPLSSSDYAAARTNVTQKRYGTIFSATPSAGKQIADLLKLDPVQ
ncbi:PstS family phosphate ABC transporter substrate-binding protein [Lyngbya confervoides]|uniref:Phosphate-binding protein n=1 Tax=Lyngbya confervoides BDU141951 TaxID=1574623 RepID=A0ABD4T9J3_9CYAN|nr:PstS family phosphate ABC transporter substrate-binding protein [Lyngbya confervoides]MCM1985266.1 PstS family phosphate ABC transporter substrate-binding protein [Lyngbya confervoides BDU141951]